MLSLRASLVLCLLFAVQGCTPPTQAAQFAPYYAPAQNYACNGQQHDSGFALDYGQAVYIRHIEMVVTGALPGQHGTVTLSTDVAPGQSAPFIAGFGGVETGAHVDFGVNAVMVPAAQALSLEWSCDGGGSRTLLMTISYTANAGPNP